jgi:hypothetical protein
MSTSCHRQKTTPETVSVATPHTQVGDDARPNELEPLPMGGQGLPSNKIEEEIEHKSQLDDWEHDPANPRNWSPLKKWTATTLVTIRLLFSSYLSRFPQVSFYTLLTALASSMMAPGLPDLAIKYGLTNPTLVALTLTIFVLSMAIGPLVLAPMSEIYGRAGVCWHPATVLASLDDFQVLHIGNLFFLCFNLGCALAPSASSLIVFRFLGVS